jgi:molybdenum cofactor cytidylyltransferase
VKGTSAIAAVILAAGQSSRMERFKPLLPIGSGRAIERVAQAFLSAGISDLIVVTGHRADELQQTLAPLKVSCVENKQYRQGMFSSVQAGIRALPASCPAFFIHPADIPLVRPHTIRRLVDAFQAWRPAVLYPLFDGRRGHPTLIQRDLIPGILSWKGTGGLRACLQDREAASRELPVADEAVLMDMDTPADYRRLQARSLRGDLPSAAEVRVLMEGIQKLPADVVAHCRAVAAIARRLADALAAAGVSIDSELTEAAALLHDIARTQPDHARAGARLLETHGFPRLAPLVADHMDLAADGEAPLDEAQIVFLADKLAAGDRLVDLEERFGRKMDKYGRDPDVAAAIARRRDNARRVQAKVETAAGRSLMTIIGETENRGEMER